MRQDDVVRQTVSLPQDAVSFLDRSAKYNFTSRNAEIVRSIRERMQAATGGRFGDTTPAAAENHAARQGGASSTQETGPLR